MAVLTAAAIKGRFLPAIKSTSSSQDSAIEATVDRADALLAAHLGVTLADDGTRSLGAKTYDIYLLGPGGKVLRLPWFSPSGLTITERVGRSSDKVVSSSDYEVRGRLVYKNSGTWLSSSLPELRVQGSGGGAIATTSPLYEAIGLLTAHLWNIPKLQGRSALSQNGKSQTVRDGEVAIPANVKALVSHLRVGWF